MSKSVITDTRIRICPTDKILKVIAENLDENSAVPENIVKLLQKNNYDVPTKIELIKVVKHSEIDVELLRKLLKKNGSNAFDKGAKHSPSLVEQNLDEELDTEHPVKTDGVYMLLNDLIWLKDFLAKLRIENGHGFYIHDLIQGCELKLPENDIIERNPELEARCQKLREEQQNREYRQMTKNVDTTTKYAPDDSIAYQMKSMNSQIIAVFQFVVSVVAGFVFGFLGVELIVGNLDFGFRLLLGIICALIIALAEIYFLAKKLNEYDVIVDASQMKTTTATTPIKNKNI